MPEVQTPLEFLRDFHATIDKAKYRIYIQSMNFENGEIMGEIAPLLMQKAKSGVDVRMYIDWIADRYIHENLQLIPNFRKSHIQYYRQLLAKNAQLRQDLLAAGVNFIQTNQPSPLQRVVPIIGRNHKKMYVVDNDAAWVGGVNFADHAFRNVDCMIKVDEPDFVETVASQFYDEKMTLHKDIVEKISDHYQLVIDGGKKGSSIIYDTALAMASHSQKSIIFASQFLPDGPLLEMLIKKHMYGVRVIILTSPENTAGFHKFPYKFAFAKSKKTLETHGIKIHFLTNKVHAKILFIDNQELLLGSNNLVKFGVNLGTQEIALWTNESTLIHKFRDFLYKHVFKYNEERFFGDSLPFFI